MKGLRWPRQLRFTLTRKSFCHQCLQEIQGMGWTNGEWDLCMSCWSEILPDGILPDDIATPGWINWLANAANWIREWKAEGPAPAPMGTRRD